MNRLLSVSSRFVLVEPHDQTALTLMASFAIVAMLVGLMCWVLYVNQLFEVPFAVDPIGMCA